MQFKAHPALVSPSKETATAAKAYLVSEANIKVPKTYTRRIVLQSTQPLLESNGILRWALNNVAHADTPACSAMLQDVYDDPAWVTKNAIKAKYNGVSGYFTNGTLTGTGSGVQVRPPLWCYKMLGVPLWHRLLWFVESSNTRI